MGIVLEAAAESDADVDASVAGLSLEGLAAEVCRRAASTNPFGVVEWLVLVAAFDRRRGWQQSGCASCAAWLVGQIGIDIRTAGDKVLVAHTLVAYPGFRAAMASGALTYANVKALSRIVTIDNAAELLDAALAAASKQTEPVATYRCGVPSAEHAEHAEARSHTGGRCRYVTRAPPP